MAIYIPNKIKVGYQKREGTYTNKLAYVIYYDEKGKLRKEHSWQKWRDQSIDPDDFENVPTEGFVLNKKVGGVENSWGWNARQSYCRVYDPRGFEFEIDIYNLLYILEYCDSIKGKGLVGKFVYGWEGKDLILIPVDSPDYKKHIELSSIVNKNNTIKIKDLKVGATYIDKNNNEYIYMGRFDYYEDYCYEIDGKVFFTYGSMVKYCENNNIDYYKTNGCYSVIRKMYKENITAMTGKRHWFFTNTKYDGFIKLKSISGKFVKCINENCVSNYSELYEEMECNSYYSPIDEDRIEYCYYTYEEFLNRCEESYHINFISDIEGILEKYSTYFDFEKQILNFYHNHVSGLRDYFDEKFYINNQLKIDVKTCFEKLKPMYRQVYLKNGKKYMRSNEVK